jgi:predicted TIM-barrel fold metal-dependent hydrolase
MPPAAARSVDMHMHVAVLGTPESATGFMSLAMQHSIPYQIFLLYARIPPNEANDARLRQGALDVIRSSTVDHVVCLALDAVFDASGTQRLDQTTLFVPNDFVFGLRDDLPDRILAGASVHPYDPKFKQRVTDAVARGAVLLKWLPSAQQINLADPRVGQALRFLAGAGSGGCPLPLLLHVGTEGAIISTDQRTMSYDFLSWGFWDKVGNLLRPKAKRWLTPDLIKLHSNLRSGLDCGACIIFAHCGLPYFAPSVFSKILEHNDIDNVADYLQRYPGQNGTIRGKAFADVSACVTPFRLSYFPRIAALPKESVLVGSDFPVPIFELSADLAKNLKDLEAVLNGQLDRILVPQGNLLDVNQRELKQAFPNHPMFTNAAQLPNWT